jgi:NAD(P)-dependent dehydrogenase (short-subunit alcohol dehydrogenase family)
MAKQPVPLSGKVAVVTGGARGIGRAVARALVAEGAQVAIGDVDAEAARDAALALGGGTLALPLDVSDRPGFSAFLDEVEERLGPIDVLVNNAGIMPIGPFEEETDATVTRQLEINLHGVIHGTKEAVRRMRPRGTGHIVNLASVAGVGPLPGAATYCATKYGVVGLSETVRLELRGTGVEISYVLPGHVDTELTAGVRSALRPVGPEAVAEAIVGVLRHPRPQVFVPANLRVPVTLTSLLPRRVGEGLGRLLKADRALLDFDRTQRAGYEARAAASAPAADELAA